MPFSPTVDEEYRDYATANDPRSNPYNPELPRLRLLHNHVKALAEGVAQTGHFLVPLVNADEGTANEIDLACSVDLFAASFSGLFEIPFTAVNTGPMTAVVNDGAAVPLKLLDGSDVEPGGVGPGCLALGKWTGTEIRMHIAGDITRFLRAPYDSSVDLMLPAIESDSGGRGPILKSDRSGFEWGPNAADISNAQGYAEDAEASAARVDLGALDSAVARSESASVISESASAISESAKDLAREYSNNDEDDDVTGFPGEYSAKHFAIKSEESETSANAAKNLAETARDEAQIGAAAALVAGKIYDDTTLGLAGTDTDEYFFIKSDGDPYLAELWKNVSGVAVDQNLGNISTEGVFKYLPKMQLDTAVGPDGTIAKLVAPSGRFLPLINDDLSFDAKTQIMRFGEGKMRYNQIDAGEPGIFMVAPTGRWYPLMESNEEAHNGEAVSKSGSLYFTDEEINAAEAIGQAEVDRRMAQDLSNLPEYIAGYSGVALEGQSYQAQDGTTGLYCTTALMTSMGWESNGLSVGRDARSYSAGSSFLPFEGGVTQRTLNPLSEHVVMGSDTDEIVTDANAALGNFPSNARTGDTSALCAVVFDYLNKKYHRLNGLQSDRNTIFMNKAKGEGSLAAILSGAGMDRFKHMHTVFNEAIAAGPNSTWGKQWMAVLMEHGQADESAATAGYATSLATAMDTLWSDQQIKTGQTKRPPWIMSQVGSKRGRAAMACAQAQLDMSTDLTGTNAYAFLTHSTTELPTLHDTAMPVEAGNDHPNMAAKVLLAVRQAIALYYLVVRREPYFIPYVHKYYRDGHRALIVMPNIGGGLRPSALPYGVTPRLPDHWGFQNQNAAGNATDTIKDIRVVPGKKYLIEVFFESDNDTNCVLAAGTINNTDQTGQVFVRDNFSIDQPVNFEVDHYSRVWHNALYGLPGDTGEGYFEVLGDTGAGRYGYANDVPGIAGENMDLGNPAARSLTDAEPLPTI